MAIVRLGNAAPIHGENVLHGDYVSEITVHDDVDPHHDQVRTITHVDGLWARLSGQPATWVCCPELPRLEMALAAHFDCSIIDVEEAQARSAAAYASGHGNLALVDGWGPEEGEIQP